MRPNYYRLPTLVFYTLPVLLLCLAAWAAPDYLIGTNRSKADGPKIVVAPPPIEKGDAAAGRNVFRFETFVDEGFWTDAARVPQGMKAAKTTPLDALKLGLSFDADRIEPALRQALAREVRTNHSRRSAPLINDPKTLNKLLNSEAVIGFVVKNSAGENGGDVAHGGKVGVTCALCHTITDGSVASLPEGGGIGHREDGRTQHFLNVGKLLATAANSRAFYVGLQFGPAGKTIGRAPRGLPDDPTESQVDAYLSNPKYYPIGTFDDTPDGNGNSVHIVPFFRQDLAAPYGSSGQNAKLDDFNNTVYTVLFDQTTLTTPGGRAFLKAEAGAAGLKLSDNYIKILKETGVTGYPYIHAAKMGAPGKDPTLVGLRVDNKKLLDLNAYVAALRAPRGVVTDREAVVRGRELFRSECTSCHNVDQSKPVSDVLIPMKRIYPGYQPKVIAYRKPPLSPVQNAPGTFDDKMVVVDASGRGGIRGAALPLLLDLARKPVFLHDDSVHSLDSLLSPRRGAMAPHPFYIPNASRRADMTAFLRSLDTGK